MESSDVLRPATDEEFLKFATARNGTGYFSNIPVNVMRKIGSAHHQLVGEISWSPTVHKMRKEAPKLPLNLSVGGCAACIYFTYQESWFDPFLPSEFRAMSVDKKEKATFNRNLREFIRQCDFLQSGNWNGVNAITKQIDKASVETQKPLGRPTKIKGIKVVINKGGEIDMEELERVENLIKSLASGKAKVEMTTGNQYLLVDDSTAAGNVVVENNPLLAALQSNAIIDNLQSGFVQATGIPLSIKDVISVTTVTRYQSQLVQLVTDSHKKVIERQTTVALRETSVSVLYKRRNNKTATLTLTTIAEVSMTTDQFSNTATYSVPAFKIVCESSECDGVVVEVNNNSSGSSDMDVDNNNITNTTTTTNNNKRRQEELRQQIQEMRLQQQQDPNWISGKKNPRWKRADYYEPPPLQIKAAPFIGPTPPRMDVLLRQSDKILYNPRFSGTVNSFLHNATLLDLEASTFDWGAGHFRKKVGDTPRRVEPHIERQRDADLAMSTECVIHGGESHPHLHNGTPVTMTQAARMPVNTSANLNRPEPLSMADSMRRRKPYDQWSSHMAMHTVGDTAAAHAKETLWGNPYTNSLNDLYQDMRDEIQHDSRRTAHDYNEDMKTYCREDIVAAAVRLRRDGRIAEAETEIEKLNLPENKAQSNPFEEPYQQKVMQFHYKEGIEKLAKETYQRAGATCAVIAYADCAETSAVREQEVHTSLAELMEKHGVRFLPQGQKIHLPPFMPEVFEVLKSLDLQFHLALTGNRVYLVAPQQTALEKTLNLMPSMRGLMEVLWFWFVVRYGDAPLVAGNVDILLTPPDASKFELDCGPPLTAYESHKLVNHHALCERLTIFLGYNEGFEGDTMLGGFTMPDFAYRTFKAFEEDRKQLLPSYSDRPTPPVYRDTLKLARPIVKERLELNLEFMHGHVGANVHIRPYLPKPVKTLEWLPKQAKDVKHRALFDCDVYKLYLQLWADWLRTDILVLGTGHVKTEKFCSFTRENVPNVHLVLVAESFGNDGEVNWYMLMT